MGPSLLYCQCCHRVFARAFFVATAAGSRQNTRLRRLAERSWLGGPPRQAAEGKSAGTRPTNGTREVLSVRRPAPGIWRRRPTTTRPPPRQGGERGESGVVGRKTRTGKARSLTSRHGRSLQDANSNTDEEGRKKARAQSPSSKKVRAKVAGEDRVGRRIVAGAGRVPRSQTDCRSASTVVPRSRRALRVWVSPACGCRPTGPERGFEIVYGAARPPQHRLRTTGASPALTAQKRDGPPHSPAPPRQHAGSVRSSAGASAGARQGRATMHGTAQPAYGAVPGRAPVWPGGRLRHPHAAKASWPSARPTCCVIASR